MMNFRVSLLAQTCALVLGGTLLQACDSSGEFASSSAANLGSGNSTFVGLSSPNSNETSGGNGGGTGDSGDGGNGGGTGDGGDSGDGDNGDGTGDGGDSGDGGTGDGTGDGSNTGGGSLGPSSSELAIETLDHSASNANLARFSHALTTVTSTTDNPHACVNGGYATLTTTNGQNTRSWNFSNCVLASENGTAVSYNGQLRSDCGSAARTGLEQAVFCEVTFTQLQSIYGDQSITYNGSYNTISESESLAVTATNFTTVSTSASWASQSQSIATEASELRGLNARIDTSKDGLALTVLGKDGYRQASTGCLVEGSVQVKDAFGSAELNIASAIGGNMIVDDGLSSTTVACSELSPMPYAAPQFN